ncbi:hypothetical protein PsYK624_027550 [Phanerochaete sordida]|uniref:Uncharacterized protein n=1 Tax=Phanerochaete sordida TaxID=48140 RepID=A0A9P3G2X8_9APHY|nr:hypothetical protein PsYK624_027550 [Phanerochaete sordida]
MVSTTAASRFKSRLSRKLHSLTRSSRSLDPATRVKAAKATKAPRKREGDQNRFVASLRALSLRHLSNLKTSSQHARDFHTAPALADHAPKRKIIRVSKLNFGPFEPEVPLPSTTTDSVATIRATTASGIPALGERPAPMGLGLRDLPGPASASAALCDPAATMTGKTAAWWKAAPAGDVSAVTQRSCYSQGSWVEVTAAMAAGAEMPTSTSIVTLDSLASELLRSEDWSHDSEASRSFRSAGGPWNAGDLTTSSINETSFLRMAEAELGW